MDTTNAKWPEILGSKNWQNILDPLDLNLRKLILNCGDFCQGTYDSFNNDQNSKYCGSCRYGKTNLFEKVMLENAVDYQVVSYLYGTARVSLPESFLLHSRSRESWDRETNWIGYVASTSDEYTKVLGRREIYVVFRGTTRDYEWIDILGAKLKSASPLLKKSTYKIQLADSDSSSDSDDDDNKIAKVMLGWLTIYISDDPNSSFTKVSLRTQLQKVITQIRERYKDDNLSIIFTGHSLGACLSVLGAFDIVENGVTDIPVAAFVFGCPHIGNKAFNDRFNQYPNLKVLHIVNKIDLIPHYPGRLLGYVQTGTELLIDTRKSPSLKDSRNPSDWHNLQAMLHVVAGWNGENGKYELRVKRSLALVNKSCSFLKDECLVPGSWWVEKNKGMVRNADGEWVMAAPDEEDLPIPEF